MSVEAMKQALEALEDKVINEYKVVRAITSLRQAIAEAEKQEPVEWGVDWGPDGNSVSIIKRLAGGGIEVVAWEYAPHPPQRQWVGLTPQERDEINEQVYGTVPHHVAFHHAIEAKLKEKNT